MNRWLRRLFAIVLFAYPRDFRDDYRAEMTGYFEAEHLSRQQALRNFCDVITTAFSMRFENFVRDLLYAVRMNIKAPLFTTVVIGTIALAIGANAVIFTILNAVLLKPLPYEHADRLGVIQAKMPQSEPGTFMLLDVKQLNELSADSTAFRSVSGLMVQDSVSASGLGKLRQALVTPNYFATLGTRPELGRFISAANASAQAVISYALWRARFGASGSVLGRTITLEQKTYTIVGVAPADARDPGFSTLENTDVWTELPVTTQAIGKQMYGLLPLARLRDGITWQAAAADLNRIARNTVHGRSAPIRRLHYGIAPLSDIIFGSARSFLWIVYCAVTGVLLIACANIGNLLLARNAVRRPEFAVRTALGASVSRLTAQVFTETMLLAATGALCGLAIAWAALPWAKQLVGDYPRLEGAHIDVSVLLYVCVLMLAVTFVTGLVPAYKFGAARRIRFVLVALEVAVAFTLIVGSGLMLRSFIAMTNVDRGFIPSGLFAATAVPKRPPSSMQAQPPRSPAAARIARAIAAIPGVSGVAYGTNLPFSDVFMVDETFPVRAGYSASVNISQVSANYFHITGIPLLAGRAFNNADFNVHKPAVLVNEAFVREYFPRTIPIGRRIGPKFAWHIVGIVGDTRSSLTSAAAPMVYWPYNGSFEPYVGIAIRTAGPVPSLAKQVTAIVNRFEPNAGETTVASVQSAIDDDTASTRKSLALLTALAAAALLLALSGIYSVVSFATARRFHEIGIRIALGAPPPGIVLQIVAGSLVQAAGGIAAGLVLCAFTTRLLTSELFQTSPLDPYTLVGAALLIVAWSSAAALVPACRSARMPPAATLRYE